MAFCSFNDDSPNQIWSYHGFTIINDWNIDLKYNYGYHLEIIGYAHNGGIYTHGGIGTAFANNTGEGPHVPNYSKIRKYVYTYSL